jgi:transposase
MDHSPSNKDLPVAANGRHVVGIDIGQARHAAAGLTAVGAIFGRELSFENNRAGVERLEQHLLAHLGGPGKVLIGMEATGHYWMPLYYELTRRGYHVIVINPIQTRGKFRSRIRKTKTDKLDARSIARLVLSGEAHAARIPTESTLELRLLTRQRWWLMDIAGDMARFASCLIDRIFPEYQGLFSKPLIAAGRALIEEYGLLPRELYDNSATLHAFLHKASRGVLAKSKIDTLLARAKDSIGLPLAQKTLAEQLRNTLAMIGTLESQIAQVDAELEQRVKHLNSPLASLGLRAPLIATIHAESDPISDFKHYWQYVAYTGLDPATYDSGKMHGTRVHISKRGSPYLRRALYMAAFAVYRHHNVFHRLYLKIRKAKRHHVHALVVIAHKLARIIWRLLTDNRPFTARAPKTMGTSLAAADAN